MKKTITCSICGKTYSTDSPNSKYCSLSCREAARQIRRQKWVNGHPKYSTQYMRKYRLRKKGTQDNITDQHNAAERA